VARALKTAHTSYENLQILEKSLPDKTPINQLLIKYNHKNVKGKYGNLLLFN
jgi:hypothetical protein